MLSMFLALAAANDGRVDLVCVGQGSANKQTSSSAYMYDSNGNLICPLLSGPKLMIFWITKEIMNAEQEASPGRDYWQAA